MNSKKYLMTYSWIFHFLLLFFWWLFMEGIMIVYLYCLSEWKLCDCLLLFPSTSSLLVISMSLGSSENKYCDSNFSRPDSWKSLDPCVFFGKFQHSLFVTSPSGGHVGRTFCYPRSKPAINPWREFLQTNRLYIVYGSPIDPSIWINGWTIDKCQMY